MRRILLTALGTALLVFFGMQNFKHVNVSLVFGTPLKIRLCFLLLIAAVGGFLLSYLRGLTRELRLKKEIVRMVGLHKATVVELPAIQREEQEYDDDDI